MAQNQPPKAPASRAQRATNFLAYGFALSILLHAIVGPFIKFEQTHTEEETPQKVTVERIPTPPPTPPPTPTPKPTKPPTPPPTPPPKTTPPPHTPAPVQPKLKINTQKTESKSNTGPTEQTNRYTTGTSQGIPQGVGTAKPVPSAPPATPAPTAPPTPTPTPRPACANPNSPPTTISAYPPEMPPLAQQQGITGTVRVKVTLDANSNVVSAIVMQSPSALLNQAAVQAAKQSKFKTEVKNCVPQAADYLFLVEFQSE